MGIVEFVAGPLIGGIFGFLGREQDMKAKKIEIEAKKVDQLHETQKWNFELTMRDKERAAKQEENEQLMEMNREKTEQDLTRAVVEGSYKGLTASLEHDSKLQSGIGWIEGLRSLIRPVLTVGTVVAATALCWYSNTADIQQTAALTLLTNASMAFAWWFGDRSAVKLKSRYLNDV